MITSRELAKIASVSQATVSRALNNSPLVSEETKIKIKKLAAEYNFQFNSQAKGLRTNKTDTIGYVFSENFSGFSKHFAQSELYYNTRNYLLKSKLDLIPIFDHKFDCDMGNIEKAIRNKKIDGLIVNRAGLNEVLTDLIKENNLPCIYVYDPDEESDKQYVIASNHFKSGYIVGEAFCKKGYSNFVEVLGLKNRHDVNRKHDGFSKALNEYGYKIEKKQMIYSDYTFEDAYDKAIKNIDLFKCSSACFVHNDTMALGVIKALKENNIKIPDDISIIGHDNLFISSWFEPQLTTISIDYDKISKIAADWMVDLLKNKNFNDWRKIVINGELIIRDTFK